MKTDLNKLLSKLRLDRESIEEAILVLERAKGTETKTGPSWLRKVTHSNDQDEELTYEKVLDWLRGKRERIENAILAIERLVRDGKEAPETADETP